MAATIADVMTRDPVSVAPDMSAADAARRMRDIGAGDVLVMDQGRLAGIVTDRDIAVRLVADGRSADTPVSEICSSDQLATIDSRMSLNDAVELMRERAVRRIPVVDDGKPVGVVSIGDLALRMDPSSALADISAQPSNS